MYTNTMQVNTPIRSYPESSNQRRSKFSRLIAAALVSPDFCERLLTNSYNAIISGYQSESFSFTPEEMNLIGSIRAVDLSDFSAQLLDLLDQDRKMIPVADYVVRPSLAPSR